MRKSLLLLAFVTLTSVAAPRPSPEDIAWYRELGAKLKDSGAFILSTPLGDRRIPFVLERTALEPELKIQSLGAGTSEQTNITFWLKIFVGANSHMIVNDQKIPLTCIAIEGQDNRYAGKLPSPRHPNVVLRVHLVGNDFSCDGPLNRGFPTNGGREETWDTYLFYQIKDPTLMLPVEAHLRYRWNDYEVYPEHNYLGDK